MPHFLGCVGERRVSVEMPGLRIQRVTAALVWVFGVLIWPSRFVEDDFRVLTFFDSVGLRLFQGLHPGLDTWANSLSGYCSTLYVSVTSRCPLRNVGPIAAINIKGPDALINNGRFRCDRGRCWSWD